MQKTKFLSVGLCFILLWEATALRPDRGIAASARRIEAITRMLAEGELIEAPPDATSYVAVDRIGQVVLASGARIRLSATYEPGAPPALGAVVLAGDLFVKLATGAEAIVQTGGSTFVASPGSGFHASLHNGRGLFNASENVAVEFGNWAIRLPDATRSWDHWAINLPATLSSLATISAPATLNASAPKPPVHLRLDLTARAQPIGSVESLGVLTLNHRPAEYRGLLWGDELIQAPTSVGATATLAGLGQVTLAGGAQVRLTPALANFTAGRQVLSATLLTGGATFKLQPGVAACVEAGGATFVAARGMRFRVLMVEGRAVIDAAGDGVLEMGVWPLSGVAVLPSITHSQDPAAPRRYLIRPVGLNSNLVVRARSTRQIQVRVTDENDRPLDGVPIIFLLGSAGGTAIGSLGPISLASTTIKTFTNAQGIASVNYNAAAEAQSGTITANVEGTNASWTGQISLVKIVPGFWSPQNIAPLAITAAAAGVAIGVSQTTVSGENQQPLRLKGGPVIKP